MGLVNDFKSFLHIGSKASTTTTVVDPGGAKFEGSIIKSYLPEFLYKPPFGFPRNQDVPFLRKLGRNAYVHSIVSTIQHQIGGAKRNLCVKEGKTEDDALKKKIMEFFDNPNGNAESFDELLRALVKDILELDSGVWVKVFNGQGEFTQLFARDGGTFLKNPDPHGYLGDRAEYVKSFHFVWNENSKHYDLVNDYATVESLRDVQHDAAYWQYGWARANVPVPFGRREIMWFTNNPQSDSIYGRSPLEILGSVLLTLIYGGAYNLDFYVNNNMPDGMIKLIGANADQIEAFRARWDNEFIQKDILDYNRKIHHKVPIVNTEADFVPFNMTSKDMEVLAQQEWFWKIALAAFNVTSSEMGFTEDSNKASEVVQSSVFKRKAIAPLLRLIEYRINMQLMPELDPSGTYEFKFDDYDLNEDAKKHELYQMQIAMGIKTAEMVAEEEGIDVEQLKKQKEEARSQRMEETSAQYGDYGGQFNDGGQDTERGNDKTERNTKSSPVLDEDLGLEEYMKTVREQTLEMARSLSFDRQGSLEEIG